MIIDEAFLSSAVSNLPSIAAGDVTQHIRYDVNARNALKHPESRIFFMSDERLSRMEDKLDKLSEAVVEMARMEERLLTIFKRLEHMDAAFKKYDDRVDEIEKQALIRGQKIAFAERLFWMVVTGALGLAFVFLRIRKFTDS